MQRVDECQTLDEIFTECLPAGDRALYTEMDEAIAAGRPLVIQPGEISGPQLAWLIPLIETGWVARILAAGDTGPLREICGHLGIPIAPPESGDAGVRSANNPLMPFVVKALLDNRRRYAEEVARWDEETVFAVDPKAKGYLKPRAKA